MKVSSKEKGAARKLLFAAILAIIAFFAIAWNMPVPTEQWRDLNQTMGLWWILILSGILATAACCRAQQVEVPAHV